MVALPKSDKGNFTKSTLTSLALTALAAHGARAQAAGPSTDFTNWAKQSVRMDTTRRLPDHLRPGNASLADFVASVGNDTLQSGGGRIAGAAHGGYHAATVAAMNGSFVTHPAKAAAPALPPHAGRKLLNEPLITAQVHGCPRSSYSAMSTVGGQNAWALLDTGSSTYAVASSQCDDCGTAGYTPGRSATVTQTPIEADYGSGSWNGIIVKDQVTLVGATAAQVALGDITAQTHFFNPNWCVGGTNGAVNNQAIMGLGGNANLFDGTTSYIQAVKNTLYYPGFAFGLCDYNGDFFLGGYPTDLLQGDLFRTPMVTDSIYLSMAMLGISVGNVDTGVTYNSLGATLVDSGTTGLTLPTAAFQKVVNTIVQQSKGYLTRDFFVNNDCLTNFDASRLPTMTFNIYDPTYPDGSQYHTLTKTALTSYATVDVDAQGVAHLCPLLLDGSDGGSSIFGSTAMRALVTYYDLQANSIGFGISKGICS